MLAPLGVLRLAVGMMPAFGSLLLLTLFFAPEVKGAHALAADARACRCSRASS